MIGNGEEGTPNQIDDIVRAYAAFTEAGISKIFDNEDFGYTRVTVERPLRLRYRMTVEDKARFLDACPHLLNDVQTIDAELGREPISDWNSVLDRLFEIHHMRKSVWKKAELKLFRDVFTQKDPDAEPVRIDSTNALSRMLTCGTLRTFRLRMTLTITSSAKYCHTYLTHGWIEARTKWAMRSTSTVIFTNTSRHGRWKKSTPI